jgi:transposase
MATTEEIRRRVEEADTARSTRRSAAAQRIGELAARRADVAEQLDDIERQLGDELAAAQDVVDIDELAQFTDVSAADLTRWLAARKPTRTKRPRPAAGRPGAQSDPSRASGSRTAVAGQASTKPERAVPRAGAPAVPARVPAEVA